MDKKKRPKLCTRSCCGGFIYSRFFLRFFFGFSAASDSCLTTIAAAHSLPVSDTVIGASVALPCAGSESPTATRRCISPAQSSSAEEGARCWRGRQRTPAGAEAQLAQHGVDGDLVSVRGLVPLHPHTRTHRLARSRLVPRHLDVPLRQSISQHEVTDLHRERQTFKRRKRSSRGRCAHSS